MATRVRQPTAGPSRHRESIGGPSTAPAPSQRQPSTALPPYETPVFPLNPAAQRALDNLTRAHSLKKLDDGLVEAQQTLQMAAAAINDRVTERENRVKKRKTPADGATPEDDGAAERGLEELRDKVERMTQRMDESMRKMIDGQHSVESIKTSIAATAARVRADASTQASTQGVGTQRARRRRRVSEGDGEDADEEDEEYQDFTPTDPRGGTQPQKTAIETFRATLEDSKTRYQSHSLTARYAENNSYRDFRRLVHDAKHPADGVQLAHHSEWFEEGQAPAPGVTTRARQRADDEDGSDDDLAVSRMTISTKCPLTLQEFKKPLTSKKCPHSFESEAILGLLSASNQRQNGRSGEKIVQCPVSGCSQVLTRNDLHTDAVLIRQIERLQRSKALEAEDEEQQDGNEGGATVIEDGDDDAADVDDIVEGRTKIKGEPKGTGRTEASRGTQRAIDLESESETEEDDGDETMEDE